jgi:hypothetical protein
MLDALLLWAGVTATAPPAGATNPSVSQQNIQSTICVSGWTSTVRPPAAYTTSLKRRQLPPATNLSLYEEDHLIPLELGGCPTCEANLWPQPWTGTWNAHVKDHLENELHKRVCAGQMLLRDAQLMIAKDWQAAYCIIFPGRPPC